MKARTLTDRRDHCPTSGPIPSPESPPHAATSPQKNSPRTKAKGVKSLTNSQRPARRHRQHRIIFGRKEPALRLGLRRVELGPHHGQLAQGRIPFPRQGEAVALAVGRARGVCCRSCLGGVVLDLEAPLRLFALAGPRRERPG